MVEQGIIEPVKYAKWADPIVPVMKPNKAVLIDSYSLPKPEELFSKLAGGVDFSKLDMSQAYAQLLLDDESKEITTINTQERSF